MIIIAKETQNVPRQAHNVDDVGISGVFINKRLGVVNKGWLSAIHRQAMGLFQNLDTKEI